MESYFSRYVFTFNLYFQSILGFMCKEHVCEHTHMRGTEDNLLGLGLSFPHLGPRNQAQDLRHGGQAPFQAEPYHQL